MSFNTFEQNYGHLFNGDGRAMLQAYNDKVWMMASEQLEGSSLSSMASQKVSNPMPTIDTNKPWLDVIADCAAAQVAYKKATDAVIVADIKLAEAKHQREKAAEKFAAARKTLHSSAESQVNRIAGVTVDLVNYPHHAFGGWPSESQSSYSTSQQIPPLTAVFCDPLHEGQTRSLSDRPRSHLDELTVERHALSFHPVKPPA
jgi:hypothetical protein